MSPSPFFVPVSLPRTALLLSDVQVQILSRFPKDVQTEYLAKVQTLLDFFRGQASKQRAEAASTKPDESLYSHAPLIIHHTLPFNLNSNAFVSPYNKLAKWVAKLEAQGFFSKASSDPHHPDFGIPKELYPPNGWGSKDEIALGKLAPSCFTSSDLLAYLRARDIRHIVLVGLTTMGSILGSARAGADLDFHISLVEELCLDDDPEINEILVKKVLPKFVDVVSMKDVLALGEPSS